ncbi:hypothetical protein D3C80_1428670 [compost metagenome]
MPIAPGLQLLQHQQLAAAVLAVQAALVEQRLQGRIGVAKHCADGLGRQLFRGQRSTVASAAYQQVSLVQQRDAPDKIPRPIIEPLGADIAAHIYITAVHRLLQAQAGHDVVFGAYAHLLGQGLHQVVQQTFHRLVAFDAHQRHAPALGDRKTQHGLFSLAVGAPQQQQGQQSSQRQSSLDGAPVSKLRRLAQGAILPPLR